MSSRFLWGDSWWGIISPCIIELYPWTMLHILNCPWRPWQICSCLRTHPLLQYFQVFEAKQPLMCLFWSSQELFKFPVYIWTFFQNLGKNYEIIALRGRPAATTLMADSIVVQAISIHTHVRSGRQTWGFDVLNCTRTTSRACAVAQ